MKRLAFKFVNIILTHYNIAWIGLCEHARSPDVFAYPLPKCPECGK